MIEGKLWGNTETLIATPFVSVHRLNIEAQKTCSRHLHAHKYNGFLLLSGKVNIRIWQPSGAEDVTVLIPGDLTAVAPGLEHRFECHEQARMLEIYWPAELGEDIVRRDVGGVLKLSSAEP